MTDPKSKKDTVRRYLKGMKHERSYDEKKALREGKRRRARPQDKKRTRERFDDRDETFESQAFDTFEKMKRADPVLPREPKAPVDPTIAEPSDARGAVAGERTGTVVSVRSGHVHLLSDGDTVPARLIRSIARVQQTAIAVGDEVVMEREESSAPGTGESTGDASSDAWRVVAVQPRRTRLSRPDPGNPHRERVLAANVDVAAVVVAAKRPALHPGLIDRYLIALERGGVEPLIVLNKVDLLDSEEERRETFARLDPYVRLGVTVVQASALEGAGIDDLRAHVTGRTCVFSGHSGVGKSALLNRLDPDGGRRTFAPRASDGRGRHTTTSSMLRELGDGTRVIDTPGIRAFGLYRIAKRELASWFPEIAEVATRCRFRDCLHIGEPECAVRDAAEAGRIPRERYDAYARILESLDS